VLAKINHITLKLFLLIMALQILNLSIDAVDFNPLNNYNISNYFNYYNSMVEYISENVTNKDIFPELPEKNAKNAPVFKHIVFKVIPINSINLFIKICPLSVQENRICCNDNKSLQFIKEITPPPPKV